MSQEESLMNPEGPTERQKPSRVEWIRGLITELEGKIGKDQLKATVGDYIRLIQLERELTIEAAKEVRLEWKEPGTSGGG